MTDIHDEIIFWRRHLKECRIEDKKREESDE